MFTTSEDDTWGVLAFFMSFCPEKIYSHIVRFR